MAQIRRLPRYRSPPPRQIPSLPNPIRFRPPIRNNARTIPPPENDISNNKQYDPASGLLIVTNNSDQSLATFTPSTNQFGKQSLSEVNINIEESVILPKLTDDDNEVLNKKHLPVYAQFPFNVSLVSHPMEINVEDNVHKLRLRLIDSELNHQRRSTDEYIKRTQEELSLSSPTPTEYDVHNDRPPSELVHQQVVPSILSRQTSLSITSVSTPLSSSGLSRDRIGIDNDLPNSFNIERELEIRRIQESLNKRRRTNQHITISNYSYDPRLHLQPLNEEQIYTSSNMDDLIDSMARRHLAYRRLDAAIDRQRRSNAFIEPLNTDRSSVRNDDLLYSKRSARNQNGHEPVLINPNGFNQMLRSRIDYYNRIQPDLDSMNNDDSMRPNSHTKLPPISSGHSQNPSTLYQTKSNSQDASEHLIDLPSDIFLSSRTKASNSSQRTHKTQSRSISKDRRSGTDRSDVENEIPITHRPKKNSTNSQQGFFTESSHQQIKYRRNLFKRTAIGVLFLITLKHRSIKNRPNRLIQSASATIHKIRLQEMIVALHRVYLEPDGPIFNALIQAINNPISLQNGLNSSSKNYSEAIKIIGNAVKNIISKITEFMPKDGVLGTVKTSAVSALIQDGNPFPENYFWQCERERLEFDNLKVKNINKQRAILLLIGVFIFRALVTTLLIKPVKYRLILGQLTPNQSISLKVLASVILYIARRVAGAKSQTLALPHEWQLSLYTDGDIEAITQHSEIKLIIDTCDQSLHMWCEEYIRRIDKSFDKELRI